MKIERLEEQISIDPCHLVRLTEMGNITEIMYSEKGLTVVTLQRLTLTIM